MVATLRTTTQETPVDALVRLVGKARQEGVKLQHNPATGQYLASSVSTPGTRHALTPAGCDCTDFAQYGRCKHYAALMAALGFLPQPGEAVPVPSTCRHCERRGYWIQARKVGRGQYARVDVPCPYCSSDGHTGKVAV